MDGMYTTEQKLDANERPTQQTYDAWQEAYDRFNWQLFEGDLPGCLITLQRKGASFGYFRPKRFIRDDKVACDEIALNPAHFRTRSAHQTLSTLLHEMVHLWQYHLGTPGRGRYHNRQWAEKMKTVGLYPSHTGKPGGRELGDQMSHYVLEDGDFTREASSLIASGFQIEWGDEKPKLTVVRPVHVTGGEVLYFEDDEETSSGQNGGDQRVAGSPPSKAGKRIKYTCPECGLNAWARHDAVLLCGLDHMPTAMPASLEDGS